jgi:MerR family transcriptional regulator, light-induced transcriptional regulator
VTHLSTQEVARLIDVAETTIKRWADEGKIPCHRTLGGHRKFLMKDIVRFAEENAYPLIGILALPGPERKAQSLEFAVQTRNFERISRLFYDEALRAESRKLYMFLSYLCKHHLPFPAIGDEVIRPAMARVGEGWRSGTLEINQEHRASNAVLEGLILLNPELHRKPSNGLAVVCACVEGDYHELGLRVLSSSLEMEGWRVHYLGANTPRETLQTFAGSARPDLICLSATILDGKNGSVDDIRAIGKTAREISAVCLVGGSFPGNYSAGDFHCDGISASVGEAVTFLKDRFDLRPGPSKKR